jgi:homopolymeric O-antigen transport system ATP-binding protein
MSDVAIRVEGLGKQYRIGAKQARYRTLREALTSAALTPVHAFQTLAGRRPRAPREWVWALRDVSFEVRRGEVLGVVGRNGAGKSTLLKVLARITEPSCGHGEIRGRVGSLLEVGTGFHPELTGRENVFLNGAILGMRRREILKHFDAIVDFAGVERFIDTPVKHYSSGMYLRLAFAVAAHLEPEILLVDEVLAVGDAEFQRKCLGKMENVASEGRTVLFVSHNMAAVRALCTRGLVIDHGRMAYFGGISEAVHAYTTALETGGERGSGPVSFTNLVVRGARGGRAVAPGEPFELGCRIHLPEGFPSFRLFCIVRDGAGDLVMHCRTDTDDLAGLREGGEHEVRLRFPPLWLRPGAYSAHFKVIADSYDAGEARFVSDHVLLDVDGEVPAETRLGYLTPAVEWASTAAV